MKENFVLKEGAKAKFDINWVQFLNGDTISSSSWDTDGLTGSNAAFTDTKTSIILEGGSEGDVHTIVNSIVTADTLEEPYTICIKIVKDYCDSNGCCCSDY